MTMGDQGELYACDLHAHKKALIELGQLGWDWVPITAQVLDARKPRKGWEGTFDTVLADVLLRAGGHSQKAGDSL